MYRDFLESSLPYTDGGPVSYIYSFMRYFFIIFVVARPRSRVFSSARRGLIFSVRFNEIFGPLPSPALINIQHEKKRKRQARLSTITDAFSPFRFIIIIICFILQPPYLCWTFAFFLSLSLFMSQFHLFRPLLYHRHYYHHPGSSSFPALAPSMPSSRTHTSFADRIVSFCLALTHYCTLLSIAFDVSCHFSYSFIPHTHTHP